MDSEELVSQLLTVWRLNNQILLYLLDHVPAKGLAALPAGSKGRDVTAQFAHLHTVRSAWVSYQSTGKRPVMARYDKTQPPSKAELKRSLTSSGNAVEAFLEKALRGQTRTRMFAGQPVRWMTYLIAHDSQHRGQILLALKQSGMRLPESVSIQGVWGKWFSGK